MPRGRRGWENTRGTETLEGKKSRHAKNSPIREAAHPDRARSDAYNTENLGIGG